MDQVDRLFAIPFGGHHHILMVNDNTDSYAAWGKVTGCIGSASPQLVMVENHFQLSVVSRLWGVKVEALRRLKEKAWLWRPYHE